MHEHRASLRSYAASARLITARLHGICLRDLSIAGACGATRFALMSPLAPAVFKFLAPPVALRESESLVSSGCTEGARLSLLITRKSEARETAGFASFRLCLLVLTTTGMDYTMKSLTRKSGSRNTPPALSEARRLRRRSRPHSKSRELTPAELRQTTPVEACLRCGQLLIKADITFTLHCVEGRQAVVRVCYRCVRSGRVRVISRDEEAQAA